MNDGIEILDAKQYFDELQRVIVSLPKEGIDQIADTLVRAYDAGRTVYLCGNGGSAALASHFACDLGKGTAYCNGGKRLLVLSLTETLPPLPPCPTPSPLDTVFPNQP